MLPHEPLQPTLQLKPTFDVHETEYRTDWESHVVKNLEQSATPGKELEPGYRPGVRHYLWRALRIGALWGNLLYVASFLAVLGVLMGLGPAPWRAYMNVLLMLVLAAGTPLLNVRAARIAGLTPVVSVFAIILNLVCLGYLMFKPEYSVFALKLLVMMVPLLNIVVIVSGRCHRPAAEDRASRSGA